jgi:hypothetical protein
VSYCLIKDKGQIQREENNLACNLLKIEAAVDEMNNGRNKEVAVRMGQRNRRSSIERWRQCWLDSCEQNLDDVIMKLWYYFSS